MQVRQGRLQPAVQDKGRHVDTLRSRASYVLMKQLRYEFGQKLICDDGKILWATESQYNYENKARSRKRRDILFIEGVERVNGTANALCCETVCTRPFTLLAIRLHILNNTL